MIAAVTTIKLLLKERIHGNFDGDYIADYEEGQMHSFGVMR